MTLSTESWTLIGVSLIMFEVLGVVSAVYAMLKARTSQGAIAWVVALVAWLVVSLVRGRDAIPFQN